MTRIAVAAGVAAGMLALAACSGEVVGGGQRDVDTYATADGGSPSPSIRSALVPNGDGTFRGQLLTAQGTVVFDARFSLVAAAGGATRLTEETETVTVPLPGGGDSVRVSREAVPDLRYSAVRLEFSRVQATVTGGLTLGGAPFTGTVDVDLGTAPLTVDVPVTIDEGGEDDVTLVVDLDASSWLATADPVTRRVTAAAFSSAIDARVH